jgi:AAA15 family ATPase/GTPase
MKISFDDFRSFHRSGPIDIKPITVLVGENSSGKSSLLAGTRFLLESVFVGEAAFNNPAERPAIGIRTENGRPDLGKI